MKKLLVLLMLILSCEIANATSATIQPYQIINFRTTVNQMIADAGVHGTTGNTGATGNQGIQGIPGNDGLNGTSVFNPMISTGDMVYGVINGTPNRLIPNITTNKKYLTMTGDGVNGLSPTWSTLPAMDLLMYVLSTDNSITGTTNTTVLANYILPANTLGDNGVLKITCLFTWTNNSNNKIIKVNFGGTAFLNMTKTTNFCQQVQATICNRNSTNSQISPPANLLSLGQISASPPLATAIDTTTNNAITFTAQLASANDTVTLNSIIVEIIK